MRSARERLGRDKAQAYREGQFDVNKLNYGKNLAVAGMTAPRMAQTGSTSSGTSSGSSKTVQSESPWGTIGGMAAQFAPFSL